MISSEKILSLLPQTQCGECGFPGCKPYAESIAKGKAKINLCPPGGLATLEALAEITQQDAEPLKLALLSRVKNPRIVKIREAECIGCTKCLKACPVDAIFGAAKQMHVVLGDECTGCELCIDPCPVDCIDLVPVESLQYNKQKAKMRYEAKLERSDFQRAGMLTVVEKNTGEIEAKETRKRFIQEALARTKMKKDSK